MIIVTATKLVVCVGDISFPFPGTEIEKARSERGTHLGWEKHGGKWGENELPAVNPKHFTDKANKWQNNT